MKKIILSLFLVLSLTIIGASTVFAHTLETNQSIGAVMHIDPDDDPFIGSPATIFFDIHDKDKKFKKAYCDCTAAVVKNEKILFSQPLPRDANSTSFAYTFQEKGDYEIRLTGVPLQKDQFQKFEIEFPVSVSRELSSKQAQGSGIIYWLGTHMYHTAAGVIIIIMSLIFLILRLTGRVKGE